MTPLVALTAAVLAAVTSPFPGVKLVRQGSSAMVVANLCAPGVSVRTTAYAERRGTPQTWAGRVGAQVAINGDFFDFPGWTWVIGRARGAGQDWPAGLQNREPRPYWEFGPHLAQFVPTGAIAPPSTAIASQIVAGHNTLILDGRSRGPAFDGDGVILTAHRRTAVGLSKDRRTLFLYATDRSLDGNGVVAELVAMQREAGAPAIDVATNMDGGGSSQLYVQGLGQIVTSGREVNNHLGILARGGTAVGGMCNQVPPRGAVDSATCTGVTGWAQDTNTSDAPVQVHVYYGAAAGAGVPGKSVPANIRRADLCTPLAGSCNHGFTAPAPESWFDGKPRPVHTYALDTEGGPTKELPLKNLTCTVPNPTGVKRHIVSGASLTAWKLSAFWNVRPVTDAVLAALPEDLAWPTTPVMVRATGDTKVYLLDSGFKRHVQSSAIAAAWSLDLTTVQGRTAAQVAAIPTGPPLPAKRVIVKGTGPAVYAMDVALPVADAGVDAGLTDGGLADAGAEDAGVDDADAGELDLDAGLPPEEDLDGGEQLPIAPDDDADAGTEPIFPTDPAQLSEPGCGCGAGSGGVAVLFALLGLSRRRRAR
ncbi:MAG: phosphodiester glycosidase family protein [Myxococcaceae bacterium]|nr:phosphodiester glycosidase family protein [Myxococcaceae bacterium]